MLHLNIPGTGKPMLRSNRNATPSLKPLIFEHNTITEEFVEKAKNQQPWFCHGHIVFNLICLAALCYIAIMISSRCIGTPNDLDLDIVAIGHRRYHLTPTGRKNELKKMLTLWHAFSQMHNIRYSLMFGGLLGKYRSNDFNDWERDVDVMIVDMQQLCDLIDSYPSNEYLPAPFDNIFLSSAKTERLMRPNDFERLDSINDYVLRVECGRAIFGRLTHLYSGLTLEWWNPNKITYYHVRPIKYLDEEIIENVVLPEQACSISNVQTFCPKDIEGVLNVIYHHDLAPPYIENNWYKYYFTRLGVVIIVQCLFNYWYDKRKYKCMELTKFMIKEFALVFVICLLLGFVLCMGDLADGAWCL